MLSKQAGTELLPRVRRNYLAVVIVTAAAVRIGFLLWNLSGTYFTPQNTLSHVYFQRGYALAAGYGYVYGGSAAAESLLRDLHHLGEFHSGAGAQATLSTTDVTPDVAHPPGTALLIAAFHRFFGIKADVPLQIFAVLLDTASAGIFLWLVTAAFAARIGLVAGLLYALFPPFAYQAVAKEPDGMMSFFLTACLACALKAATAERWNAFLSWNLVAGLSVGVSAYLRPDYLLMPLVLGLGLWALTQRLWSSLAAVGVIQAVALLVLLPWAVRNQNVCGRWIFTSTMVGAVLITGLGEFHNPWGFGALDEDRITQAKTQGLASPWDCQGDLYFRGLFFASVLERPSGYIVAILKRLPLVFATPHGFGFQNPWKTTTFTDALDAGEDRYQVLLRRPGYVLAAYWDHLAMAGLTLLCWVATLWVAVKEREKAAFLLLLGSPHLYSVGAHLLTHMEPRFLLPSAFSLLIGPSYLFARVSRSLPAGRFTRGRLSKPFGLVSPPPITEGAARNAE